MLKEAEQGEAIAAQAPLAQQADSESIQPMALLKRFFEQLGAIPWVAFGAISTGLGVALLYFYFESIDFVPADIPAILSASLFVALLAAAFYLYTVGSLLLPLWAYREAGLDDQTEIRRPSSLWALQVAGTGAFLLFIGYQMWRDCKPSAEYLAIPGTVLLLVGGIGWLWYDRKRAGHQYPWWRRQLSAMNVCFFGTFPFLALFSLLYPMQGAGWEHLGVLVAVWLLVVLGSSTLFLKIPLWGCVLLVMVVTPLFMVPIPGMLGRASHLPELVAEMAGIRAKQANELRVPAKTCELIQSALGAAMSVEPVTCNEGGGWGSVHAQVLSNLGDRWLIELPLAGTQPQGRNGAIRITIPGEGVHTVRQIAVLPAAENATGCRT